MAQPLVNKTSPLIKWTNIRLEISTGGAVEHAKEVILWRRNTPKASAKPATRRTRKFRKRKSTCKVTQLTILESQWGTRKAWCNRNLAAQVLEADHSRWTRVMNQCSDRLTCLTATHICLCSRATEGLGQSCPQVSLSSTVHEVSRINQVLRGIPRISINQQMVTIRAIPSNSQIIEIPALKEVQPGRLTATVVIFSHRGDQLSQSSTETDQHSYHWYTVKTLSIN